MGDMSLVDLSIIPIDSIQKIEITKGNNSVLYGNNSSAGTINIITDTLPRAKRLFVCQIHSRIIW